MKEASQKIFYLYEMWRIGKFIETESRLVSAKGWGMLGRNKDWPFNGYGVFLGGENILELDCGDGCTTLNILKTIELYALKGWTVHELYFNKLFKNKT